jgi:hypothetical protein
MALFTLKKKRLSYKDSSHRVTTKLDALDFLGSDTSGISARDAFQQLHAVVHGALEDVDKAIQMLFEQLRPDGNMSNRILLEANSEIRNELARASSLADLRRDDIQRQIHQKLECLFIQNLIESPSQEPAIRKWDHLSARVVQRDLPAVTEFSLNEFSIGGDKMRRRLSRWQNQTDEWLETLCLNHVAEIIRAMEEEIRDYVASWVEVTGAVRRRATLGGSLFQQVYDPEVWSFDSDDPTVRNLLRGQQAQNIADRILNRFILSKTDLEEIAETVWNALNSVPVYGTNRVSIQELEELLALAISQKVQDTVSVEAGFLSLISNGVRFSEELGELLAELQRGTAAMEQKLWRVGEVGVGHVDSASGVGITSSNVHDIVLRGLGGGRRFAAVEGHPGDNHRFEVQMSIVGAPATDLTYFHDMVYAWYSWHFEEDRGSAGTQIEWLENVKNECWKLYPDIGVDTGVRNAIIELIDEDLRSLWKGREGLTPRVTNGNGLPGDQQLLEELWRELGIITEPVGIENST